MKAWVRGHFKVLDDREVDLTPRGSKERALLALLILSPGQHRTRAWLQDKLWSDRSPQQASVSLRQALAKCRKAFGAGADCLRADRSFIWLSPQAAIDETAPGEPADYLEDIDIRDPEFENWLRDLRQSRASLPQRLAQEPGPVRPGRPQVEIVHHAIGATLEGRFLSRDLAGRIAQGLQAAGDIDIEMDIDILPGATVFLPSTPDGPQAPDGSVQIETLDDDSFWHVLVRVLGPPGRRCVWAGRLRLPLHPASLWESVEVIQLCNRAVHATLDMVSKTAARSPIGAIQRAVRRIEDYDRIGLAAADVLLQGAQNGDTTGLALAWRAYVRLTQALEYRENAGALGEAAVAMLDEALGRHGDNSVILAIAAQVQMELIGDFDHSRFLAERAVLANDQNPHALNMMSHRLLLQGDPERGHGFAEAARRAATGQPGSFAYDLQGAFCALGLGRFAEACDLMLICHRKKPSYRPPLRYLVALNLLLGHEAEARYYAGKLRQLEPDFTPALMLNPSYPFETARRLGLLEAIRSRVW